MKANYILSCVGAVVLFFQAASGQESLPPLSGPPFNGQVPTTADSSWMGYDPRAGDIEATVLKSWSEQNCSLKVIRYTIGIFKGQKSRMVGVLAYPATGSNFPGLVHIHGGGQSAMTGYAKNVAMNGYAVLSLNWGEDRFSIGTQGTWTEPNTEWRGIDASQKRTNDHWDGGTSVMPSATTIDNVPSPRNNNWWILSLATRRGLTYLEHVAKVDTSKLGVWGFSMGGHITYMVAAIDKRVKAANQQAAAKVIPCNCPTMTGYKLWMGGVSAYAYSPLLTAPMVFDNCSNDHHGLIDDVKRVTDLLKIPDSLYRWTRGINIGHIETPATSSNVVLWFNKWLKNSYAFPKTPRRSWEKLANNTIAYTMMPDTTKPINSLSIYYTIEDKSNPISATSRRWTGATPAKISSGIWRATLPAISSSQRMRMFAAVLYGLNPCVSGPMGACATEHQITSDMDNSDVPVPLISTAAPSTGNAFAVRATVRGSKVTFSSSGRNGAFNSLTIADAQGRMVANLWGNSVENGQRLIEWDYAGQGAGLYFYKADFGIGSLRGKVVVGN